LPAVPEDEQTPPVDPVPEVTTVVVVYGEEPWLERCVTALLESEGVRSRVVLVENGGSESTIERLAAHPEVTVVRPGRNTGFAEGCNIGVEVCDTPFVALVNPDAVVEPDALAELVRVAARPDVGLATASVRLADHPDHLNSAGNDINFLGLSWSGAFDEPAADHDTEVDAAAASGAGLACRLEVWRALGGMVPEFFAYYEDAELSIRTWQRGLRVTYVPTARIVHRYEFSRNTAKFFLLERNRLVMTLTCFGPRQLTAVAPLLVPLEVGLLLMAARDGWMSEKVRSYRWLLENRRWIRDRRRTVQAARTTPESALTVHLVDHLQPGNLPGAHPPEVLSRVVSAYWAIVGRMAGLARRRR
jgi:GT2 family glycosyltransferase